MVTTATTTAEPPLTAKNKTARKAAAAKKEKPVPPKDGEVVITNNKDGNEKCRTVRWGLWKSALKPRPYRGNVVKLFYGRRVTFTGQGQIAWESTLELAAHLHRTGHVPDLSRRKCRADWSPEKRKDLAIIAGQGGKKGGG